MSQNTAITPLARRRSLCGVCLYSIFYKSIREDEPMGGSIVYLGGMAFAVSLAACAMESSPGLVDSSPTSPDAAVPHDAAARPDAMGSPTDAATLDAMVVPVDANPDPGDAAVDPGDSPFVARLASSDGAFLDQFGLAIALMDDGRLLAVGAPNHDQSAQDDGAIYLFRRDEDRWTFIDKKKAAPVERCNFGATIAATNGRLVIGAPGCGLVYVYEQNTAGDWVEAATLAPADSGPRAYEFGHSVAVDGDTIAVGTFPQPTDAVPGAVYVFEKQGDVWIQVALLGGADGHADDRFGHRVLLRGDRLLVGAYGHARGGAVYVFHRDENHVWKQGDMLLAPDAGELHDPTFGASLALERDTLIVGAIHADGASPVSGAAYVFRDRDGAWLPVAKLVAPGGAYRDLCGIAVAIVGAHVFVGAMYARAATPAPTGGVFRFSEGQDGTWSYHDALVPDTAVGGSQFGMRLHASGGLLAIGSVREPLTTIETGIVHIVDVSRAVDAAARP